MKNKEFMSVLDNETSITFYYVEDEDGRIVSAPKTKKDAKYRCPICKIVMNRYQRRDTIYFARKAGTHHLNPICRALECGRKSRSFPKNMTPEEFIMRFTREPMEKNMGPRTKTPIDPNPPIDSNPPIDPNQSMEKKLTTTILKHVDESDICRRDPNEMNGKYKLIDVFLHYWWAQEFFANRAHVDLGPRIVWCIFDYYINDVNERKLIFRIFNYDKREKKIVFQVKFCVSFMNGPAFQKQLKRVCKYTENPKTGKMEQQPMLALIAGIDWKALAREKCLSCCRMWNRDKCEKCCGMFEIEFSSEKQIYARENK